MGLTHWNGIERCITLWKNLKAAVSTTLRQNSETQKAGGKPASLKHLGSD